MYFLKVHTRTVDHTLSYTVDHTQVLETQNGLVCLSAYAKPGGGVLEREQEELALPAYFAKVVSHFVPRISFRSSSESISQ